MFQTPFAFQLLRLSKIFQAHKKDDKEGGCVSQSFSNKRLFQKHLHRRKIRPEQRNDNFQVL